MKADVGDRLQYLSFKLGNESFAIEISKVREVLDYTETTKIPRTPPFMIGVISLRGNIVPVVDLKQSLGLQPSDLRKDTCIIIIEIRVHGNTLVLGAVADSVQEVLEFDAGAIGAPPKIGTKLKTDFLKGIGKRDDTFTLILNMDRVFSAGELEAVETTLSIAPEAMHTEAEGAQVSEYT